MNTERILSENKKVMDFINEFRNKNEYNPISLDEYNAKFKKEFNHFLENSNFSDAVVQLFKID